MVVTVTDRQSLVDDLIRDEGLRLKVYEDSLGIATIGVGRNLSGKGISHSEALLLLEHDIDEAIADLATFPWFPLLGTARQHVLVNMRFNLGPVRFRIFKRMLTALAAGDYQKAAVSMRESKWYGQVKGRAVRLVRQMQTGEVA